MSRNTFFQNLSLFLGINKDSIFLFNKLSQFKSLSFKGKREMLKKNNNLILNKLNSTKESIYNLNKFLNSLKIVVGQFP